MACNLDCIFWGKQTKLTCATWVIFLGKWKNIKKWSVPFGFSIKNVLNLKKVSLVYLYIFTLHLLQPLSQHSLPPSRDMPDSLISYMETTNQNETKDHEKRSDFQQILLFCLDLCTQNPVLREVGLNSPRREAVTKLTC